MSADSSTLGESDIAFEKEFLADENQKVKKFQIFRHKIVEIQRRKQFWRGRVVAIDPITSSFVLCDTHLRLTLLPHLELKEVQLAAQETAPEIEKLAEFERFAKTLSQAAVQPSHGQEEGEDDENSHAIETRKARVIDCLRKNQLAVEETGINTLVIEGGVAEIEWPYSKNSCISANEVVLQRICSILANLPL